MKIMLNYKHLFMQLLHRDFRASLMPRKKE